MNAQVCVAKGVDLIAARSATWRASTTFPWSRTRRSPAPCTARSRWTRKSPEHNRAVAEIIGYVMRLRRAVGAAQTL
jgi:hypothetical protein